MLHSKLAAEEKSHHDSYFLAKNIITILFTNCDQQKQKKIYLMSINYFFWLKHFLLQQITKYIFFLNTSQ